MSTDEWYRAISAREAKFDEMIRPAIKSAEGAIAAATNAVKVWGDHFGATGIDPKHLFVYFVLPTKKEVARFRQSPSWVSIKCALRTDLSIAGYPVSALRDAWVELYSEQQCQEVANGNWYHFFK
jgi:hypothetical protein